MGWMSMLILSVDTTATPASVCLFKDNKIIAEYYINTRLTHSQTLMSMIESVLTVTDTDVKDIDLYAVNNGPGSFTGVRIGVAAVKGMAYAQDKPCAAISTLESIAYNFLQNDCIVCACMDARRNQVYNALFCVDGDTVLRFTDDRAISVSELLDELSTLNKRIILAGDGAELVYAADKEHITTLAPHHLRYQRASSTAIAAQKAEKISCTELMPSYLRLSQAERKRKERINES